MYRYDIWYAVTLYDVYTSYHSYTAAVIVYIRYYCYNLAAVARRFSLFNIITVVP